MMIKIYQLLSASGGLEDEGALTLRCSLGGEKRHTTNLIISFGLIHTISRGFRRVPPNCKHAYEKIILHFSSSVASAC